MSKKFLLIPAMPTPNGALHLGHIGAQFLKLDILNRHFNSRGYSSTFLCGLDVYDNAISVEAEQKEQDENTVCQQNHQKIKDDLALFDIVPDNMINWREPPWQSVWQTVLEKTNHSLAPYKANVNENIPYNETSDEPIVGRWLEAECPACNNPIHGFSCDLCTLEFSPEEVKNPRPKKGGKLTWRRVSNEFVEAQPLNLKSYHQRLMLEPQASERLKKMLSQPSSYMIRWTTYDNYGLKTAKTGQVYNNYAFSLLEAVAFGEIVKSKLNLQYNAFDPKSDVTTIVAYGRDCSNVFLINIPTLMMVAGLSPYDYQIISPFYLMEQKKMSTNKKFAVWVQQLKQLNQFSSDSARAFMASIAIPGAEPNISLAQIESSFEKYEELIGKPLNGLLTIEQLANTDVMQLDVSLINLALKALDRETIYLQLENINLPKVYQLIVNWVDQISSYANDLRKLHTLTVCIAVISYALLPNISRKLWKHLGLNGLPSYHFLLDCHGRLTTAASQ